MIDNQEPPRVLIVDDEEINRRILQAPFERGGYEVLSAAGGAEALELIGIGAAEEPQQKFDVIILDVMMPGEDGLSLCRHLVETRGLPVIFLTAKGEAMDRILGLELGADDYVVKPFEPRELVARIRTVLRRVDRTAAPQTEMADWLYRFEGWVLDPLKHKLTDPEGVTVPISTAEFRLLRAFLDKPRQVMDRDLLLDLVQGRSAQLFDRAVDNQVSRLRRKIEVDTSNPQLILTVRGGGYRFAANVKRVPPGIENP